MKSDEDLDPLDRLILDIIQGDFPLVSRPYAKIGEMVGITEDEAYSRVKKMRNNGLIRRIGANFQSGKIGFASTLCAARVSESQKENFIERINAINGVTHNYEREHSYNIWFTLINESREETEKILSGLEKETGIKILNLPATRLYKIKVNFNMT